MHSSLFSFSPPRRTYRTCTSDRSLEFNFY
jgi:hypothetical protein